MPMPYPTRTSLPAYSHYNHSDPNVTQSVPTNEQRWQPYNSPASSAGELPHLNRIATPGISTQLESTLFLHDSNDPQLDFDPSSRPDIFSDFGVYPSETQVPEEHIHFNDSQPIADGTGSHAGSPDTADVSTSPRFFVYVPNDSSEAGPSNAPYHMLPETDSGQLSRNSSKSKPKGEPRVKSVACNHCRSKKNKCVGVSGERCECVSSFLFISASAYKFMT
ncbi:hypothetical protein IW261DRAFT_907926 [Armillaria novae-zelandiae]|uniref:Zn(2)-C6 fungal-type domain-containing protein n=1 Tax=Armillaria novae-zelandiae TaxID=153914 RepID=A0AA39NSQ4_9AGAR|nr:hypothetical protein IW261DRAFT_907926 [Armillaria novae-zelandiae]